MIYQSLHYADLAEHIWILDSGETDHITPFEHLINDITHMSTYLHLPNGQSAPVLKSGNALLLSQLVLHNVLCVPMFKYNLISIPKLAQQFNCGITFTTGRCYL